MAGAWPKDIVEGDNLEGDIGKGLKEKRGMGDRKNQAMSDIQRMDELN